MSALAPLLRPPSRCRLLVLLVYFPHIPSHKKRRIAPESQLSWLADCCGRSATTERETRALHRKLQTFDAHDDGTLYMWDEDARARKIKRTPRKRGANEGTTQLAD